MSSRLPVFKLRLYVAGDALNSTLAIANLNDLRESHPGANFEIDIVDVFCEPQRALKDGIFMTPTLVKLSPQPVRRIVGTLSHVHTVLQVLGLAEQLP